MRRCFASSSASVVLILMAAGIASGNLMVNPSFEYGIDSWKVVNWNESQTTVTNEFANSGDYSLKNVHTLYNNGTFGGSWTSVGQDVSQRITPGEMYQLSFFYRTTSPDEFRFAFGNKWLTVRDSAIVDVIPIADGGWYQVASTPFTRSSDELARNPMLAFYYEYHVKLGTIYIDDVSLTPAPESPATPEPSTILLLTTGLGSMLAYGFKGKRKRSL